MSFLDFLRCSRSIEIEFIRGSTFVTPQVLVDVNHCKRCFFLDNSRPYKSLPSHGGHDGASNADTSSRKTKGNLQEETFGPVIGIQKVGEPMAEVTTRAANF